MPITYDATKDIWELTDLSDQEKTGLMEIAKEHLTQFFGAQIAQRLLELAQEMGIAPSEDDDDDEDALDKIQKENMYNA
jgi:hypothetical protein